VNKANPFFLGTAPYLYFSASALPLSQREEGDQRAFVWEELGDEQKVFV